MAIDVARAVTSNRSYARSLGWERRYREICERVLRIRDRTPGEEQFAVSIADWQDQQQLRPVDGIVGPATWRAVQRALEGSNAGDDGGYDVDAAVRLNRRYAAELAWLVHRERICQLLGMSYSPDERQFAAAIANWQRHRVQPRLKVDGVLGPRTWASMRGDVLISTPPPDWSPESAEATHRSRQNALVVPVPGGVLSVPISSSGQLPDTAFLPVPAFSSNIELKAPPAGAIRGPHLVGKGSLSGKCTVHLMPEHEGLATQVAASAETIELELKRSFTEDFEVSVKVPMDVVPSLSQFTDITRIREVLIRTVEAKLKMLDFDVQLSENTALIGEAGIATDPDLCFFYGESSVVWKPGRQFVTIGQEQVPVRVEVSGKLTVKLGLTPSAWARLGRVLGRTGASALLRSVPSTVGTSVGSAVAYLLAVAALTYATVQLSAWLVEDARRRGITWAQAHAYAQGYVAFLWLGRNAETTIRGALPAHMRRFYDIGNEAAQEKNAEFSSAGDWRQALISHRRAVVETLISSGIRGAEGLRTINFETFSNDEPTFRRVVSVFEDQFR